MKLPALVLILALAPSARAGDWYVDAVNGSNMNPGTSPGSAWRTLSYAIQQAGPTGPDTIHVLPGTYDAALGESFPLRLGNAMRLVGESGPEVTIVHGAGDLIVIDSSAGNTSASTGAEALTIRGGSAGILCTAPAWTAGSLQATFRDLVVEDCSWGVYIDISNVGEFANHVRLDDVRFSNCSQQCVSANGYEFNNFTLTMTDCVVREAAFTGVVVNADYDSYGYVHLIRCRILDNGTDGVGAYGVQSGRVIADARDCLVAANGRDGIASSFLSEFTLIRCTIADNAAVGFRDQGQGADVSGSILYGNSDDLVFTGNTMVADTDIGDGDFEGVSGNISVDPLFRAPAHGDYRLGFATGCVDALSGASSPDLTGFLRGNDGDLDLVGGGDMGALELRTLDAPATVAIGDKLHFEIHAELDAFTALWLARGPLLSVPDPTPFGPRWLALPLLELVATRKVSSSNPVRHTVYVPNVPGLIGQTFGFQALSRSSAAPAGAAWTDALSVVVTP